MLQFDHALLRQLNAGHHGIAEALGRMVRNSTDLLGFRETGSNDGGGNM